MFRKHSYDVLAISSMRSRETILRLLILALLAAAVMLATAPVPKALAASFVVNSAGDQPDETPGNGVCKIAGSNLCTLRAAVEETNALGGSNLITFNIAAVNLASSLPALTGGSTTIRGNGAVTVDGGQPANGLTCFSITSSSNRIQGLTIRNCFKGISISSPAQGNYIGVDGDGSGDGQERNIIQDNGYGILIWGPGTNGTIIAGNFIGIAAGGGAAPNQVGIQIGYSNYNRIGTNGDGVSDAAERNVISANPLGGVGLYDGAYNTIAGNYIGTTADGSAALPNHTGINLLKTQQNTIGTNSDGSGDAAEQNVISGNINEGVRVDEASYNIIAGNIIGLRASGNAALPNMYSGVTIVNDSTGNLVGTNGDGVNDAGERNIISGNGKVGIAVINRPDTNVIAGNYIGTNAAGTAALGNGVAFSTGGGILVAGSSGNMIGVNAGGGGQASERNVISGNYDYGVQIDGGRYNTVGGNYIGTDASGIAPLGNGGDGVRVCCGGQGHSVGWHTSGNLIAFNKGSGVEITEDSSVGNQIMDNLIHSNGGLGIDLGGGGVTLNDPSDADAGPNNLANYPEVLLATTNGSQVLITVQFLDGLSYGDTAIIQFFASPKCDPSGYGEGQIFLGQAGYTLTGSGGTLMSTESFAVSIPIGYQVTATATWADVLTTNTSEFSACRKVESTLVQFVPNLQGMKQGVNSMLESGQLSQKQAKPLITLLNSAVKKLEQGNGDAAAGKLGAFVNKLQALVRSRKLDPTLAQPLIDQANETIEAINNPTLSGGG